MLLVTNESTKFCDFSTYKLRIMNCVARVIYNCGRQDHVTPLLRDNLHWLRVRERILFKLYLMVYRALSGLAPSYITELCVPVASSRPRSYTAAGCSWHCPAHSSGTRQARVRCRSPSCLEQSLWRCPERANT